jgi:AAA15 family ATPase/GTPase
MPEQAHSNPSALISFKAENVRSFRDEFELSMLATTLSEKGVPRAIPWREGGSELEVLPLAAIFGANASGKTNVLRAMNDMRTLVLQSFRQTPTSSMPHVPFRLDERHTGEPTRFEIDIVLEGIRHEYGFEFDRRRVLREWAYRYPHGRPALLFDRHEDVLDFGPVERVKSRAARELLRPNALFLSTAAHANHPLLLRLYEWFDRNLLLAEAPSRVPRQAYTIEMLEGDKRDLVLDLLRAADLGITGAKRYDIDDDTREKLNRVVRILAGEDDADSVGLEPLLEHLMVLEHQGADGPIEFGTDEESLGTLVWFALVGPIVDVLSRGAVFLADELDASLHPVLVAQLVNLFQSPKTNPNRAQLIFNTHAVSLLGDTASDRVVGRDQIWLTEKENEGATHLQSLADHDPRKDEAIGRRYLAGRYGGTPILSTQRFRDVAELAAAGDHAD